MQKISVGQQVKSNLVAIISLVIALSSLAYNTWRNERTEYNRNTRIAAFEVLKGLGELQMIVNYAHYNQDNQLGNPITGWGRVAFITDLATVLPSPAPAAAERLAKAWQENWNQIAEDEQSAERMSQQIDAARQDVLKVIRTLK